MEHKKHSSVMKWSLIIGIVIVMNLFFNYAISLVYTAPQYPNTMQPSPVGGVVYTKDSCVSVGGQWTDQPAETKTGVNGYCNPDFTKQQQFETAQKQYDRSVFIVLVILGVLSLISGVLIEHEVLSLAFSWGGVLSLIIASMRYWSDANSLLKVFILAMALGSLIYTAIKKFT
jgi:hypothetical protein